MRFSFIRNSLYVRRGRSIARHTQHGQVTSATPARRPARHHPQSDCAAASQSVQPCAVAEGPHRQAPYPPAAGTVTADRQRHLFPEVASCRRPFGFHKEFGPDFVLRWRLYRHESAACNDADDLRRRSRRGCRRGRAAYGTRWRTSMRASRSLTISPCYLGGAIARAGSPSAVARLAPGQAGGHGRRHGDRLHPLLFPSRWWSPASRRCRSIPAAICAPPSGPHARLAIRRAPGAPAGRRWRQPTRGCARPRLARHVRGW